MVKMVCWRQRASYLLVTVGVREGPCAERGLEILRAEEPESWEHEGGGGGGGISQREIT